MTDAVQIALISLASSSIPALITAWVTAHTRKIALSVKADQVEIVKNVKEIEKQTNSMKDALIVAAGKVGHAAGIADEKDRSNAAKASYVEGVTDEKLRAGNT